MTRYPGRAGRAGLAGLAVCAAAATLLAPARARADSTASVPGPGPNRTLLNSGVVALGVPYAASALVALTSAHQGDKALYVPVLGPWLDLGNRGSCGDGFATPCERETAYRALFVVDGIVQGIGALEIVGAFVCPETHATQAANRPTWSVAPARLALGGYGLSAFGRF